MSESGSCSTSSPPQQPQPATKRAKLRHPAAFRGVRRAGARWVCEVRVPGTTRRACRLWLGTAEAAARAHDAAVLALRGGAARLNFSDSDWLLDVPPPAALRTAGDVQRAVARAVEGFLRLQRRRAVPAATMDAEDAMSATSDPSEDHDTASSSADTVVADSVRDVDKEAYPFEQEVLRDMGRDLYYASLAEALLMDPPPAASSSDASCCDDGDCDDVSGVPLWSY
jgi:hypothetical protein